MPKAHKDKEKPVAPTARPATDPPPKVTPVVDEVKKEVSRWPALIALLLMGGVNLLLSQRLILGSSWLILPVLAALVVPAIVAQFTGNHRLNHQLLLVACGLVTFSEIASLILLLVALTDKTISAVSLLRDAGMLWISNVIVFALWYWQVDAGGPYARSHESGNVYQHQAELVFPQLTMLESRPAFKHWRPGFMDYFFVAFNTSTAFSPTDTLVLSVRLKGLSMTQASLSLITLTALAARAVNIL